MKGSDDQDAVSRRRMMVGLALGVGPCSGPQSVRRVSSGAILGAATSVADHAARFNQHLNGEISQISKGSDS